MVEYTATYNASSLFYDYRIGKVDGMIAIETYLTKKNGEKIGVYIDLDFTQAMTLIANINRALSL